MQSEGVSHIYSANDNFAVCIQQIKTDATNQLAHTSEMKWLTIGVPVSETVNLKVAASFKMTTDH